MRAAALALTLVVAQGAARADDAKPVPDKVIVVPAPKPKSDEDGEPKLSLPTEADRAAWTRSRIPARARPRLRPSSTACAAHRADACSVRRCGSGCGSIRDWSLLASFQYAVASKTSGLSGLRFAGTRRSDVARRRRASALASALGSAASSRAAPGDPDADPLASTLDTSYTFPDASHPLPSCSGVGAAGLARAE